METNLSSTSEGKKRGSEGAWHFLSPFNVIKTASCKPTLLSPTDAPHSRSPPQEVLGSQSSTNTNSRAGANSLGWHLLRLTPVLGGEKGTGKEGGIPPNGTGWSSVPQPSYKGM